MRVTLGEITPMQWPNPGRWFLPPVTDLKVHVSHYSRLDGNIILDVKLGQLAPTLAHLPPAGSWLACFWLISTFCFLPFACLLLVLVGLMTHGHAQLCAATMAFTITIH